MISSRQVLAPKVSKRWMFVAIVALLTVTAGVALPHALPAGAEPLKTGSVAEPETVGKLAYTPPEIPDAPDPKAMLMRLGLATVTVLALCVATFWVGKHWLGGASTRQTANMQLRLVETLALGNRCSVHLILVANRQVLIAADASGLKSVVPLTESFEHTLTAAGGEPIADERPVVASQSPGNTLTTNLEAARA